MKKFRKIAAVVLLVGMIAPSLNATANATATDASVEEGVEVCFTITRRDGSVRARTIVFPTLERAQEVVDFEFGACE